MSDIAAEARRVSDGALLAEFRASVRHDDRARVAALLEQQPALATASNRKGVSLLVEARLRGHTAIVARIAAARAGGEFSADELVALGDPRALARALDARGEGMHAAAEDGFTPLHRAAHLGEAEAVDELLRSGADPGVEARNASALLPHDSARCGRRPELAERLPLRPATDGGA